MNKILDWRRNSGCLFIPVMHSLPVSLQDRKNEFEWWRDNQKYFQYPVGLHAVSSLFSDGCRKTEVADKIYEENSDWREKNGVPPRGEGFLVGDSGGFLLFRKREVIQQGESDGSYSAVGYKEMLAKLMESAAWAEPSKVLRWMERNCDIGFTLDLPPFGSTTKLGDFFKESADFTYHNNREYEKARENPDFRIYSVIHGDTVVELDYWWDMMKEFKFEGYAASCFSRGDALSQAYILMYLYSRGVRKNVHLFGVGNINVIVLLAYISNFIENLTFDSFTIGQSLARRTFRMMVHKCGLRFGDIFEEENGGLEDLPCDCPVCLNSTIDDFNSKYGGYKMLLHNLYDTLRLVHFCNSVRKVPSMMNIIAKSICATNSGKVGGRDQDVIRAIEFVKECIDNGFETACHKYRLWLLTEDKLAAPHVSVQHSPACLRLLCRKDNPDKEAYRLWRYGHIRRQS